MRIAIDTTAMPRQPAGAGTYTRNLVLALGQVDKENDYFVFARRGAFREEELGGGMRLVLQDLPTRPQRALWEQSLLPLYLRRLKIDLFHSPHHTLPLLARVRQVVTFHDVTFFLIPERYPLLRRLYMQWASRLSARRAHAVIAVSQTVRADIVRVLKVPEGKVYVVPEAPGLLAGEETVAGSLDTQPTRARAPTQWDGPSLPYPYILTVGTLEPGKNHRALLLAFRELKGEPIGHKLVIAGQGGWRHERLPRLVEELGLAGEVFFTGYTPARELAALYSGASLFVFPSLYEGFGLPPLEAMAFGVPVVASAAGALPEVLGDAALLVRPEDHHSLAKAMARALADGELRRELRERGLARAREFSWESTARQTIAVYRAVMGTGER